MRIGNFAIRKMRNHNNRRTRFAWLLMMVYLPMLLALVLALTLVTNIIVQVLKSLLYDMLPTNLLAFLVAAVVTVGAGFGLWSYYRFAITGWMIVALIALIFLVAFSAMFGYDKLVQLMEQAGWIKAQK